MLAKTKVNEIEVLISKALINSYISRDEFVPVNNLLKIFDDMKGEIKNVKASSVNLEFWYTYKAMSSYC